MICTGVIYGELASKSNSRMLVKFGDRPAIIKSKKARDYEADFNKQVKKGELITEDIVLSAVVYYKTRRPDLDESLFMDCLQRGEVIKNDRQIKEKHIYWGLDKENPRVEFALSLWSGVQPNFIKQEGA